MSKVSIIIPIFNVEKYLSRCLDSVLLQTFSDFEVICVNDGSPDNCATILANYAKKDARIKIITQSNQGLSMARNNGLKQAIGEYIYILDSDDAIEPQLLEITVSLAEKYKASIVTFCFKRSYEMDFLPTFFDINKIKPKIIANPLFQGCRGKNRISFSACNKLYKKEILDGISFIPNIHFEDYPHTYAILAKKPKTVMINLPLYLYSINNESISNHKLTPKQIKDYHQGLSYIYDIYKNPNLKKELKFLKKNLMPNLLKQQLYRCQKADEKMQPFMWQAFAEELKDLNNKGLITWRGHNLFRYLKYKKIIKGLD